MCPRFYCSWLSSPHDYMCIYSSLSFLFIQLPFDVVTFQLPCFSEHYLSLFVVVLESLFFSFFFFWSQKVTGLYCSYSFQSLFPTRLHVWTCSIVFLQFLDQAMQHMLEVFSDWGPPVCRPTLVQELLDHETHRTNKQRELVSSQKTSNEHDKDLNHPR